MAHTRQSKKRIRQIEIRTTVNRQRVGDVRAAVKSVETAIQNGDAGVAAAALKAAQPVLHGSIAKGILHRNTVSRKLSRLSHRIKGLSAGA
ncbi:MAG: 30S ribosomal protein S20 [Alphaproteobacteria bacterium]